MKSRVHQLLLAITATMASVLAQVPNLINYQGRVAVGSVNFDGNGLFKFKLVDAAGTTAYWSNDGDIGTGGGEPSTAVSLAVTKGLYSVLLGDTSLTNMAALPATALSDHSDVRLRVWFNDGTNGFQLLTPDKRIAAVGYAVMAGTVNNDAITTAKLANDAVTEAKLKAKAVTADKLADGSVDSTKLAAGALSAPVVVSGTTRDAVTNKSYVATSSSPTVIRLPDTAAVGDVIQVSGTGSGGWSATNFDATLWTARDSDRAWGAVASSANGQKLVAVVGGFMPGMMGQIYTSTDTGATWTAQDSDRAWTSVASSADGVNLVATEQMGQVYTSTDSGLSWTPRGAGTRNWVAVASDSLGAKLVALDSGGKIYTSINAGVNWSARDSNRFWRSVASSADGTKLVAVESGGQIYTSANSGLTWTARDSSRSWACVASSADGVRLAAAESGGFIYLSTDSGATWTANHDLAVGNYWSGVTMSSDGMKIVAVESGSTPTGGVIHVTTDGGQNWTTQETGRYWQGVASSSDGSKLVAVVSNGKIYTSGGFAVRASGDAGTGVTLQYAGNGVWGPVADVVNTATALNTPGKTVARDANGDFSASSINLTGAANVDGNINSYTGNFLTFWGDIHTYGGNLSTTTGNITTSSGIFSGKGSSLTELNASNVSSGTLADGRLSTNIPRLSATSNAFSGDLAANSLSLPSTTGATAGVINQDGNRLIHTAGGNFFAGANAGNFGVTGTGNVGVGGAALNKASAGNNNSAMGAGSLANVTTGSNNTATGFGALAGNTTGSDNTATGYQAFLGSGAQNSAFGAGAMVNSQGTQNCGFGASCMPLAGGTGNTAVGYGSLPNLQVGSGNIAIGTNAGSGLTIGSGNIYIGSPAGAGFPPGQENGVIRIGTPGTHTSTVVAGTLSVSAVSAGTVAGAVTATTLASSGVTQFGSGTGTSEPPDRGVIVRRARSTSTTSGQVVARTDKIRLIRDGTNGGWTVSWDASPGKINFAFTGITSSNTTVVWTFYQDNPSVGGSTGVFTDAQNVVSFRGTFGSSYSAGDTTEVTLSRYPGDYFWIGTITSSYNQ